LEHPVRNLASTDESEDPTTIQEALMFVTLRRKSLAMMICLAALASGCSEGGAGLTEPEPEPEANPETERRLQRSTLILDFAHIEVVEDCDGIEGDGDFDFVVRTEVEGGSTNVLYDANPTLGPGARTPTIGRRTYTVVQGTVVYVHFEASEWDRDIFGNVYRDSRLSQRQSYTGHFFLDGDWTHLGPRSITLGTVGCMVRLHWTASFVAA
jgi:hypothetical protein